MQSSSVIKSIQIQPMLRLNKAIHFCNHATYHHSNTTNVKVKRGLIATFFFCRQHIQIQPMLRLNSMSNIVTLSCLTYSNTTNVKVKLF